MPTAAIVAALASALIHASWNAVLRAGKDRLNDSAVIALFWIVAGAIAVAVRPPIDPAAFPYVAGSGIVHSIYWFTLAKGFSKGEMSHVYTLSRGLSPALVAVIALAAAQERPDFAEACGIGLVCAGVLAVGFSPRAPVEASVWAALTAVAIAGYSVCDAMGARASQEPWGFAGWTFIASGAPILLFAMIYRGPRRLARIVRSDWKRGAVVGGVSAVGYALVLWAQSFAPIAQVSALRETSVVFGAIIAFAFLRERLGPRRWAGAAIVAAGAVTIALG